MAALVDAALQLMPSGQVTTSQDFPAIACAPRYLPTCSWVVSMLTPPANAATFTLSVSATQNGTFSPIAMLVWPASTSGSRQVRLGAGGNVAQILNNQSAWLRASVSLSGPLTVAGSWLSKASDGGPGLGSRSYSLDGINQL